MDNFLFIDLSTTDLKTFDGMAAGEFTDMRGKRVKLNPEELPDYITNTLDVLESTRTESGELVGLPIDQDNHDHRGGAGWIKGLTLDATRNVVLHSVEWTETGAELIRSNARRFYSPTIDLSNKVILGGSLTNWPATRDKKGRMLLRPIELSSQIQELADESLDEQSRRVRDAFYANSMQPKVMTEDRYIKEVYDDYVIVESAEGLYKAGYSTDADGKITFDSSDKWQKVKIEYVEATMQEANFKQTLIELANTVLDKFGGRKPEPPPEPKEQEIMTEPLTVAEFMQTPEATAELERRTNERAAELLKAEQLKIKVAEFASKFTAEGEYALAMNADELTTALLAMPEADKVMELVGRIMSAKIANFAERGTNGTKNQETGKELPAGIAELLGKWVAAGKDVPGFFAVNPELGNASDYNLSEYKKEQ